VKGGGSRGTFSAGRRYRCGLGDSEGGRGRAKEWLVWRRVERGWPRWGEWGKTSEGGWGCGGGEGGV